MAFLRSLDEKCDDARCPRRASYEVVRADGQVVGRFCETHAQLQVAQADALERAIAAREVQ